MSSTIMGVVTNGVVVPNTPLPEGAQVEIHVKPDRPEGKAVPVARPTPGELRRMPRVQRQPILAAAAELAEEDYCTDQELTGFEAFSEEEEEQDDDESHSR